MRIRWVRLAVNADVSLITLSRRSIVKVSFIGLTDVSRLCRKIVIACDNDMMNEVKLSMYLLFLLSNKIKFYKLLFRVGNIRIDIVFVADIET